MEYKHRIDTMRRINIHRLTVLRHFLLCCVAIGLHESAVTSVQFQPTDGKTVLTNGMDSRLKIVDVRTGKALQVFHNEDFHTSYNWSSSSFSPDGALCTWSGDCSSA